MHDGKVLDIDDPDVWSSIGTGTGTFANNKFNMAVTPGQYYIRQTSRYAPYFAGKVQIIEHTFDNFQIEPGVVKRVGYFSSSGVAPYADSFDGFWLENDGTTYRIIASRAGVQTINVPMASWSNAAIAQGMDWSKFNVISWEFLWLGGVTIRLWAYVNNTWVSLHECAYTGLYTDTITLSPNQPCRYEIRSTTGMGSLRAICNQIATSGSVNESGKSISVRNQTAISCNTIGTDYVLLAVRKLVASRDVPIRVLSIAAINGGTSDNGILSLRKNPTISGGSLSYTPSNTGHFEVARNTNSAIVVTPFTGRTLFNAVVSAAGISNDIVSDFMSYLGSTIDNVMDVYVLTYTPITPTQTLYGILNMKEQ